VFADSDGKPSLNVARYFNERCEGDRPDFIIVKLGINDCFGFNPDDAKQLDTQIDGFFTQPRLTVCRQAYVFPHLRTPVG